MSNKTPIPEHVIKAMRRDDGFIRAEIIRTNVEYVVSLRTADGYKRHCTISYTDFCALHDEGYIYHAGDGKWKLREKLPSDDGEHKL